MATDSGTIKLAREGVIIAVVVSVLIVAVVVFFSPGDTSDNGSVQLGEYSPPEISILITADDVVGLGNYSINFIFDQGDVIYVYEEYTGVFHNISGSDFSVNLTIFDSSESIRHFDSVNYEGEVEEWMSWVIETDESWPDGWYVASSSLVDHISSKSVTVAAPFYMGNPSLI